MIYIPYYCSPSFDNIIIIVYYIVMANNNENSLVNSHSFYEVPF